MPRPIDNWFRIGRQSLKLSKQPLPIDRSKNDRNNSCFFAVMPFQCAFHLHTIAVIGVHNIGADQQQDDLSFVEVLTDLPFPFGSCANIAVIPDINQSLSLQRSEIRLDFIEVWFIFMRITEEDFYCHERNPRLFSVSIAGLYSWASL